MPKDLDNKLEPYKDRVPLVFVAVVVAVLIGLLFGQSCAMDLSITGPLP